MQKFSLTPPFLSVAAALCLAAAAAAGPGPANTTQTANPNAAPARDSGMSNPPKGPAATSAAADQAGVKYSDAEILGSVLAVDETEIKAATAAEQKKMGKEADGFAKMLLKQHRADSAKVAKLGRKLKIDPSTTGPVEPLRTKGEADLNELSAKTGADFEKAYIDAMAQGHIDALALIDDHLMKDAQNEDIKKQLKETRKHVAEHLEHAKRLQGARASR